MTSLIFLCSSLNLANGGVCAWSSTPALQHRAVPTEGHDLPHSEQRRRSSPAPHPQRPRKNTSRRSLLRLRWFRANGSDPGQPSTTASPHDLWWGLGRAKRWRRRRKNQLPPISLLLPRMTGRNMRPPVIQWIPFLMFFFSNSCRLEVARAKIMRIVGKNSSWSALLPNFKKKSEKTISFFANSLWSVPPFAGAFWGCRNVTYAQFSADYRPSCWTKALRLSHLTVKRIVDSFTFTLTVGGFATVNCHQQFDEGPRLAKNSPFHKLSNVFRTNRWEKQAERFRVHFWTFLYLTHSSSNFRLED